MFSFAVFIFSCCMTLTPHSSGRSGWIETATFKNLFEGGIRRKDQKIRTEPCGKVGEMMKRNGLSTTLRLVRNQVQVLGQGSK